MAVVTASSSRYFKKIGGEPFVDESGEKAVEMLRKLGHEVEYLGVVNDDLWMIRTTVAKALDEAFDVVIVSGGTGVAPRDVTVEALRPLLDKELEGFGEIFRIESFKRIGASAALTRTIAGVARGKVVVALPGSPDGVALGLELFGEELPHMVHIARGSTA
ncbi:MAG: MogA/MoaB family molybdenum cofactor biosynthesis protein [Candidatus Caldarchaeum sp.]|nr:MogA/MoaB family molybdenum cofactor biosynthesis protein [Candidatus Caldarchaeum sp.]